MFQRIRASGEIEHFVSRISTPVSGVISVTTLYNIDFLVRALVLSKTVDTIISLLFSVYNSLMSLFISELDTRKILRRMSSSDEQKLILSILSLVLRKSF